MEKDYRVKQGHPYPLGVSVNADGINFAAVLRPAEENGVILYPKTKGKKESTVPSEIRIPFAKESWIGNVACMQIEGINPVEYDYNFYEDDKVITDSYAKRILGNEVWNYRHPEDGSVLKSGFVTGVYDWQGDHAPQIPYEDSIFYCMHVRGFTKHTSSKVKYKGTFAGIIEKIPYLKELGITAIELMPAYEFEEIDVITQTPFAMEYMKERYKDISLEEEQPEKKMKLNYWGFKEAYYFAPKSSYAAGNPVTEFKDLVRMLHANGIEVIMQFYFPNTVKQGYMLEVLRYWVLEYHIDGIHLKGDNLPVTLIATEPVLANTKILYYGFHYDAIYRQDEVPTYRNLAVYQDDFMYEMRKLLKGDEDKMKSLLYFIRRNDDKAGVLNYITNYYGFTLMDLVSYDKKHNEDNGEEGRDGNDYNYSWNCGVEGKSRKQSIIKMRKKQIRNAILFMMLSQGAPLLMSGDEFGNSQNGNNNPYCQDNEITWLNWNLLKSNEDIFSFVKDTIAFRKEHAILHSRKQFRQADYLECGYPDISYHGEEAWKADVSNYSRQAAVMYCENYAQGWNQDKKGFIYVAYNMHWQPHTFALPKLPKGMKWYKTIDTVESGIVQELSKEQQSVEVSERAVAVYVAKDCKMKSDTVKEMEL
ncbi:MAG: hypothetical protein IJ485_01985 [Lachnospiraceae bacterium]|nr:hypothetical protein [Lachnospiraceae bacterium]